jgi:proteasome lid subunit RPN8/RPN11
MIQLSIQNLQIILHHAESIYPEECCGVMIGKRKESKTVVEIIPTENAWNRETANDFPSSDVSHGRRRRYSISPREMLQLQKSSREKNLDIIGIFHSHPDYPAIPSEFDRSCAWQEYSYIIVSVIKGRAADINSWVLDDDSMFVEEEVRVMG